MVIKGVSVQVPVGYRNVSGPLVPPPHCTPAKEMSITLAHQWMANHNNVKWLYHSVRTWFLHIFQNKRFTF